MKRREFIAGLGSAAAWPLAARAQQRAMPVIGYLSLGSAQFASAELTSFRQGLREVGYVEGQNVTVEYRWAEGEYGRMPAFAAEFVRRPVAIIFASNTTPALAAKRATSAIPIVFRMGGGDPVNLGLAASLNRPGGNATGVMELTAALETKVLGLLRELVPNAENVAALMNPSNPSFQRKMQDLQQAARSVRLEFNVLQANTAPQIDEAFTRLAQQRTGALIVAADTFFNVRRHQITTLAAHYRIPAIYQSREFVQADGLMSYGAAAADLLRQAGIYVGRILKGEKPADLPVMQPTKFELVINLKTAKALGFEIPVKVLALADEVIE
jgi:putative tryptophan/tyrosine transport system substrate-binding protein